MASSFCINDSVLLAVPGRLSLAIQRALSEYGVHVSIATQGHARSVAEQFPGRAIVSSDNLSRKDSGELASIAEQERAKFIFITYDGDALKLIRVVKGSVCWSCIQRRTLHRNDTASLPQTDCGSTIQWSPQLLAALSVSLLEDWLPLNESFLYLSVIITVSLSTGRISSSIPVGIDGCSTCGLPFDVRATGHNELQRIMTMKSDATS